MVQNTACSCLLKQFKIQDISPTVVVMLVGIVNVALNLMIVSVDSETGG